MSYTNEGGPSLGNVDLGITLKRLDTDEASRLCRSLPDSVASACWDMAWLLFDPAATSVVDSMEQLCRTSGLFVEMCNQGLGLALFFRDGPNPPPEPGPFREYVLERIANCPDTDALIACVQGVAYAGTLWWGSFQDSLDTYQSVCAALPSPTTALVEACRAGETRIAAEQSRATSTSPTLSR